MTNEKQEQKLKDAADRVLEIRDEILDLLNEAQRLAAAYIPSKNVQANLDAYVFDQLVEHLDKSNSYNKDLGDVASAIAEGTDG